MLCLLVVGSFPHDFLMMSYVVDHLSIVCTKLGLVLWMCQF